MTYVALYFLIGVIYALFMDASWRKDTPPDGVSTWQEWTLLICAWPVLVIIQLAGRWGEYD